MTLNNTHFNKFDTIIFYCKNYSLIKRIRNTAKALNSEIIINAGWNYQNSISEQYINNKTSIYQVNRMSFNHRVIESIFAVYYNQ